MKETQLRRKLKKYYNRIGESRASWVAKDRCSQIRTDITASLLKSNLKDNDTVIDVGCGTGETFVRIRKLHGGAYVVGLDISRSAAKIAKNYADVADVIICVAVLEHLINPEQCLEEICRVSKTGAYAIIQTPNNNSLLLKVKFARNDPEHLHSFTINGLKRMLKDHGIHPTRVSSDAITALPLLKSLEMNRLKLKPDFGDNIFVEALVKKRNH